MTISSMTGFARAEGELASELGGWRWSWELKSVNGRGLDLKFRLPPGFDALEQAARAAATQRFRRGSIQATLTLSRSATGSAPVHVDLALVERLLAAGAPYVEAGRVERPRWDGLLALRGVMSSEEEVDEVDREALEAALLAGLQSALVALARAREREGAGLAAVLGELADRLQALVAKARVSAGAAPAAALERIRARLATLAPEITLDPQRLAQEATLAASRADVQEELERLHAHIGELRTLLTKPEPAGRRLDFLSQELAREANTLCAKSQDLTLTRIGLDLKIAVDQIKEQAANVE